MASLLYIYHSAFDPGNAHGNQIVHTCNALVDRGYDVTLLAAGDPDGFLSANDLDAAFRIETLPVAGRDLTYDRLGYYLAAVARSRWFDLLFTRDVSFLRVLRRVPRWWYPPTLYEAHKAYSGIDQLTAADERARLDAVDAVVTISPAIADDLSALGVDVRSVVPDAASADLLPTASVETLRTDLGLPAGETLFVYLGSLSTWKNDLDLVVEGHAAAGHDNARLLIVGGSGPAVDKLRAKADALDVGAGVRFVDRVAQATAFEYLTAADVGIVPLKIGDRIASHYTSPLKLYEYLLCGLEVIASDVPAIVDTVGDDERVHVYEHGSVDDFVRASHDAATASADSEHRRGAYKYTYARRGNQLDEVLTTLL